MAEGLRAQGHEVQVWQYGQPGFGFEVDRVIEHDGRPATYVNAFRDALTENFDVVHFHFARSLIPARDYLPWYWDLPVWRALGKVVVFTFHGSDVRLRSHHLADDKWSFFRYGDIPCDEERVEARLSIISRYAHHMTVGSVLDRPYVPGATYVPKSVDTRRLRQKTSPHRDRPVVLHAPSRRATKGTDFILAGLDEVRKRGADFEVDLIEGLEHNEVIERVAQSDIVVEKLLGGDAGVASLEAMALGKVAIARIRDEVLEAHPGLPVVSADPDTFADTVEQLLRDLDRRRRIGDAGRSYVERHHDHRVTGRRLEELYRNPGRTGVPAFPEWTIPAPQRRADSWRVRMEAAERSRTALNDRLEALQRHAQRLEEEVAELTTTNTELHEKLRQQQAPRRRRRIWPRS